MVKFLPHKNIKHICVVLGLFVALFPVCRIQAEELETQQPTLESQQSTAETKETWGQLNIISDYWIGLPWERDPLHPTYRIYRKNGLATFERWLDIETFVSPEILSGTFGDFQRFYFYCETEIELGETVPKEFYTDAYVYIFETENGGKYNIAVHIEKIQPDGAVRHLPKATENIGKRNVDPENLKKAGKPGTYWVGNIGYTYVRNEEHDEQYSTLSSIQWQSGGYVLFVDIDETAIEQYTLEDGGFIAQMLREETALGAVEQFSKELPAYNLEALVQLRLDDDNRALILWIVLSGIAFFAVTVTVLTLLHRKRKRKAAAAVVSSEETPDEIEE